MDDETTRILSRALKGVPVISENELGATRPSWSFSLDPQTGIAVLSFRPELLTQRREIDRMTEALAMHLHSLARTITHANPDLFE